MGKSTTPMYVVEMEGCTAASWNVKARTNITGHGKPTNENLAKYVEAYINSLKPGGTNYHISKALGHMPIPNFARIRRNCLGGEVLATWKAPLFMALDPLPTPDVADYLNPPNGPANQKGPFG